MKVNRLLPITRLSATASGMFELAKYFEMAFLEILPNVYRNWVFSDLVTYDHDNVQNQYLHIVSNPIVCAHPDNKLFIHMVMIILSVQNKF